MGIKKLVNKIVRSAFNVVLGSKLSQKSVIVRGGKYALEASYIDEEEMALARLSAAEGCVLLKNKDNVLPLNPDEEIAVFGRCQYDYFYVGYGSGGDVNPPYRVNIIDGLNNAEVLYNKKLAEKYYQLVNDKNYVADEGFWGHWPMSHPEIPLDEQVVIDAAQTSKKAVVIIGRAAGEDRENTTTQGSYYLTDEERALMLQVSNYFDDVIVILNIGNIIDMSFFAEYENKISAILISWQGGMESGNAVCDVLYGKVNPCGKLADTIAKAYFDYPSSLNFGNLEYNNYEEGIFVGYRYFEKYAKNDVLYPFGFGLSYSEFKIELIKFEAMFGFYSATIKVTNEGKYPGKEVLQMYCSQPDGRLPKAERVLTDFEKTDIIEPGQSEIIVVNTNNQYIASYDEEQSAFILEKGNYKFFVNDVEVGEYFTDEEIIVDQCEKALTKDVDLKSRILERMPEEPDDEFIKSLSDKELEALTRGQGMMNSKLGVAGNAGAFGGVIKSLRDKGIRPIICADGPAGLRLSRYCALLACGTALACTFDKELVESLYAKVGNEMVNWGVDVFLGPGMNIHRNPLCGRNFEYFSEDPVLSGKMAAAVVKGIQSSGKAACPKHFACNNQEVNRNHNDSRLSERTLREIYLRNFEICVREGRPKTIMTSYNKINGVWAHYNYDLATTVLRKQWGFSGVVVTDWWMRRAFSPEFPLLEDNAYRVRAQVDVLMPGDMSRVATKYKSDGSLLKTLGQEGGIKKAELYRTASNVIRLLERLS